MKIYVTTVKALRKKEERQAKTQFTTKIDGFFSFTPLPEQFVFLFFLGSFCS
jgi:hypothetical protein